MAANENQEGQSGGGNAGFVLAEVSRATGISGETIVQWEREFGAVVPREDESGEQLYSATDIDRLKAIRLLADQGHEVSEIAGLSLGDLRVCLGSETAESASGGGLPKLVVAGAAIGALLNESGGIGHRAEVVKSYANLADWLEAPGEDDEDLVLLDCPALFPETVEKITQKLEKSRALRAIVIFQFLRGGTLAMIEEPSRKLSAMRAPVTARELKLACEADLALAAIRSVSLKGAESQSSAVPESPAIPAPEEGEDLIPPRQFSDSQLSKISQISTAINCECPHHLAALLSALNAFEQYSRDCENRNEEDAALHAYLHRRTARARAIMEDALVVLAEAEGISVR